MATTPVSASAIYNSTTPTTIYTVPALKTAVVKGVLASSLVTTFDTVTLNKVSGGITYPLVQNQLTGYASWTAQANYPANVGQKTINLLDSPITLAAGDSISISSADTSYYKTENATTETTYKFLQFAYLNGNYIAVGQDTATNYGLILTSTDGITYTKRTFTALVTLSNITYGNGYYVVCNTTGATIHHSTDLVTWTQVSLPSTSPCQAITYGGGKFVTGGASGVSFYATTTPLSWTAATVFNSNTIYSIAYIGTNYFYGVNGTSYYTADFSTYSQPYVPMATGTTSAAFTPTSNAVLATNTNIPSSSANTFLRTTSTGASWSYQNTVANNQPTYQAAPKYFGNGGHITYRTQNPSNGYYLYSSNGTSWTEGTYTTIPLYNTSGPVFLGSIYQPTTNATYTNKLGYNGYAGGPYAVGINEIGTNGVIGANLYNTAMGDYQSGNYHGYQAAIPMVGNPYSGAWLAVGDYSNGGNNIGPWYGGASPTPSFVSVGGGFTNSGYGSGYMYSLGCMPASNRFLGGTSNGWVMKKEDYNSGWTYYIGTPYWITANGLPLQVGINFDLVSGNAVVGMARGGELATSPLVIAWSNGVTAVTTNQGATWTMGSIGLTSGDTYYMATHTRGNASQIQYGNGYFWFYSVTSAVGQIAYSADGLSWATMPAGVESIYNLNSQNVFITASGISTSATGVVDSFTGKGSTAFNGSPSVNRLVYIGSNYYLYQSSLLYQSSDLITWTSKNFATTAANNASYFSSTNSGLAYPGSGTSIGISYAYQASVVGGKIGKAFVPSSSIYIGNATASIVQID